MIFPLIVCLSWDFGLYTYIGLGIFVFFCFQFLINLGKKIEVRDIVVVISSLQWIVGPVLAYRYLPEKFMYAMAVPEDVYMSYVIPGVFLYIAGLYIPFYRTDLRHDSIRIYTRDLLEKYPNFDIFLILTGIISGYLSRFSPPSVYFVFFLLENVQYIGLFYLLLSKRRAKLLYVIFVMGFLFLASVRQAMFGNLLLWFVFSLIVFSFIYEFSLRRNFIIISCSLLSIFSLQIVKQEYRAIAWKTSVTGYEGTKILAEMITTEYTQDESKQEKDNRDYMLITRLNQGWIIARIMSRVPSKEPFANGETIKRSIMDSFMPRFLNPDKLRAGGAEYFNRFVGRKLQGTSMDLSVIGEGYANYGRVGGMVFMFCLGLLYNFILFFFYREAKVNPSIFLWVPLIFFFAIKAETGFYMVFNHLIKSSIFLIIFFKILNRIYKPYRMNFKDEK